MTNCQNNYTEALDETNVDFVTLKIILELYFVQKYFKICCFFSKEDRKLTKEINFKKKTAWLYEVFFSKEGIKSMGNK